MRFRHGGVAYPLELESPGRTLLQDTDPSTFFLLDYFTWAIRHYVGARLEQAAAAANVTAITGAVAEAIALNPAPYMRQAEFQFPLLAIYRAEAVLSDKTIVRRQGASTLELAFVLPSLTSEQAAQLEPLLHTIAGLIDHCAGVGSDELYTPPGGAAGDFVWGNDYAALQSLSCTRARFGGYVVTDDLYFPALVLEMTATERADGMVTQYPVMAGAGASVELVDASDLGALADLSSEGAPTLTHATPASGSVEGGTTVVLFGGGMKPGLRVHFGTSPAEVVDVLGDHAVVRAPSRPAGSNFFPVDLVVTNLDGQSARLPAAYTYT